MCVLASVEAPRASSSSSSAAQGRALGRIGAAAEFVEQDERGPRRARQAGADAHEMRRKGREVLLDLLLVADVGHDAVVERHLAALGARQGQAHAHHQGRQARALQRQGLAARVRAGDHEQVELAPEAQVERHDHRQRAALELCAQERVAEGAQHQAARVRIGDARDGAPHRARVAGRAGREFELGGALGRAAQGVAPREHAARELGQDALLLAPGVGLELGQRVGVAHDRLGLDEDRLAGLRAVVHDARHAPDELRAHGQGRTPAAPVHASGVTLGDRAAHGRIALQGRERALDRAEELGDALAQVRQARRGVVFDAPLGVERGLELLPQVQHVRQAREQRRALHEARAPHGQPGAHILERRQEAHHERELVAVEHALEFLGPRQQRARIARAGERRLVALGEQEPEELARALEGRAGLLVRARRELVQGTLAERSDDVAAQLLAHGRPVQGRGREGIGALGRGRHGRRIVGAHAWPTARIDSPTP